MFSAAIKALGDLLSRDFRSILGKAVGLTLLLFVLVFAGVQAIFWFLTFVPWPWLETLMAVGAGLGLFVAFFFLMAPVTSIFAGLFLDRVATLVEQRHYPTHAMGQPLSGFTAVTTSLQFALVVLVANLLALPLVFTGFGVVVLLAINAYLISREYFEMSAMRFMTRHEARDLRKTNAAKVFVSGFLPAALSLVPFVNLTVPLFATSYFTHLFKQVQVS